MFLNTWHAPKLGERILLRYPANQELPEKGTLVGTVVRIVPQSLRACRIPGVAVRFQRITVTKGRDGLADFLDEVLASDISHLQTAVMADHDTGAVTLHIATPMSGTTPPYPTAANKVHERRKNPRFPVDLTVSYYVDDVPYLGAIRDISQTSLFIRTEHSLPQIGTQISLQLPMAEAPDPHFIRIDATVCRHESVRTRPKPSTGYAVHFDHVGEFGRQGVFQLYLEAQRQRVAALA
jgi:hypothetical protein